MGWGACGQVSVCTEQHQGKRGREGLHKTLYSHVCTAPFHTKRLRLNQGIAESPQTTAGHREGQRARGRSSAHRNSHTPHGWPKGAGSCPKGWPVEPKTAFQATLFSNGPEQISALPLIWLGILHAAALSNGLVPPDQCCHQRNDCSAQ